MSYVYVRSERIVEDDGHITYLYTTGHYDPQGDFHGDDDFGDRDKARERVNYLNGGHGTHHPVEEFRRIASALEGLERRPA